MLFYFQGAAYRFEHLVTENINEYLSVNSKEQAINCVKQRVRENLGLIKATNIKVSGRLYIKYDDEHKEIYRYTKDKKEKIQVYKTPYLLLENGKVKLDKDVSKLYNKSVVSVEEAKDIFFKMQAKKTKYYLFKENGERFDITSAIENISKDECIEYRGEDYIYDPDEEVYWYKGHRFTDRIEVWNE